METPPGARTWIDDICANEGEAGNWGYLLVISNLAMIPVIYLAVRRHLYFEATVFFLGMMTSSIYHGIYSKVFWEDSPLGVSLNDLDHNWGYWMIVVLFTYVTRWKTTYRRIIELLTLWVILALTRVDGEWFPGIGKDLTISLAIAGFFGVWMIGRFMQLTQCSPSKISKLWMWRYLPVGFICLIGAIGSKVSGDVTGCYTTLHSLWHIFIMLTMFFFLLARDQDAKLPNSHEDDDELGSRVQIERLTASGRAVDDHSSLNSTDYELEDLEDVVVQIGVPKGKSD